MEDEFFEIQDIILSAINSIGGDMDDITGGITSSYDEDRLLISFYSTTSRKDARKFYKNFIPVVKEALSQTRFDELSSDEDYTFAYHMSRHDIYNLLGPTRGAEFMEKYAMFEVAITAYADKKISESTKVPTSSAKESERPLYIIRDSHGNQLSAPNPDDGELWDRVSAMEARGRRGLCVVAYTGKMQEDTNMMVNKSVTDKTMDEGKRGSDPAKIEKAINSMYNALCAGSANSEMMIQEAKMIYGITYSEAMDAFRKANNKFMSNKNLNEGKEKVPIHYDDIEFTHYGTQYDVDRWDETEVSTDWTYDVSKDDIVTFLIEEHGSELFDDEIPGEGMEKYILDNFDDLFDKYLDSIREHFRDAATEDAQDKWEPYSKEDYYSDNLDEAGQRYYVTTYRSDSVSGPEEGGYTSYGWMPTHSKYFPSVEDARKEMLARIEDDDEIISQDEDRIYVKDSYGDEYIVAVEPASKRGRTEEPPRTWAEAEFDDPIPRTYFDRNGAPLDHNPYAKRKAEKQKASLMNDFMSKLASCSTRDEVFDAYLNAPYQVQLDAVAEVAAKLKEIDGNLTEAHYGGAFDIEDDQYFTKEEIDEFGYEIVDTLNTLGYNKFDYNGGYVDGNVLGIQIYWADGEVAVEQIIDMRKIKTPSDLSRKYLEAMVEKAKLELEKIGADFGPHLNGQDYPIDEDFDDGEVIHLDLIEEPTLKASNVEFSHELAKELDDMFRDANLWVQELHYNPVKNQIEFDINWGDWKHEHLRARWLINDFFENKNSWVKINSWTTEEDGSDTYSAHYEIYN